MFYNAVFVYLYLYGLWPEIKSYYLLLYEVLVVLENIALRAAHFF